MDKDHLKVQSIAQTSTVMQRNFSVAHSTKLIFTKDMTLSIQDYFRLFY